MICVGFQTIVVTGKRERKKEKEKRKKKKKERREKERKEEEAVHTMTLRICTMFGLAGEIKHEVSSISIDQCLAAYHGVVRQCVDDIDPAEIQKEHAYCAEDMYQDC